MTFNGVNEPTEIDYREQNLSTIPAEIEPALSTSVREAVESYFNKMNGYPPKNLHRLVLDQAEKPLIECTLKHCNNNQSKAASVLGLSRSTLRKKIADLKIDLS